MPPLESFMIVDCGGGTVHLTTRTLLPGGKLSETCGSTYVDRLKTFMFLFSLILINSTHFFEFCCSIESLMWLSRQLGICTMKTISQKHYFSLGYVVQEFFVRKVKVPFTGDPTEFEPIFFDIEDEFPVAMQYITSKLRIIPVLEAQQWRIQLDFDTVKNMFDPVVTRIIGTTGSTTMSSDFLVGTFSESPIYTIVSVRNLRIGCQLLLFHNSLSLLLFV